MICRCEMNNGTLLVVTNEFECSDRVRSSELGLIENHW